MLTRNKENVLHQDMKCYHIRHLSPQKLATLVSLVLCSERHIGAWQSSVKIEE